MKSALVGHSFYDWRVTVIHLRTRSDVFTVAGYLLIINLLSRPVKDIRSVPRSLLSHINVDYDGPDEIKCD